MKKARVSRAFFVCPACRPEANLGLVKPVRPCYAGRYQMALDTSGFTDSRDFIMAKRSRTGNGNFRRTARKVASPNHYTPMRGGIRF